MPSASVTTKIASISFMVTTSSTDAHLLGAPLDLPPRLVLDRHAGGAALALHARLRLAGDEDLLGTGGERGRSDPVEQGGDLGVEVRQGQEARGVETHDQRPIAEHRGLATGRPGAGQDPAQDLDRDRQPEPLVGAGREERAHWIGVVLARIGRRLATTVEHDAWG